MNSFRRFDSMMSFARFRFLVSVLSVLCVLCGSSYSQEWKTVADGVEYAQVRREFSGKPVDINLLRLDLKKVRLDVHHAMDAAIGTEKTSSIATRHKAFAAINAGFFRLDNSPWAGDASGVLVVDGELYSETPVRRTAVAFFNGKGITTALFQPIDVFARVYPMTEMPEINGINRERKKGEIILYSSVFGKSTLTNLPGTEIQISKCRKSACTEFQVAENVSNSAIPTGGYVLSIDADTHDITAGFIKRMVELSKGSKKDRRMLIQHTMTPDNWLVGKYVKDTFIVGGIPQLVKNSKIDITWEQEKASKSFVESRHPRTAVAKLKDGKFLMLTADGRTEQSAGLDLYDLAEYMLELGAVDAMNLDGGGSTTMFLDGKLVNRPSGKEGERKVSDAILVTLRNKRKR